MDNKTQADRLQASLGLSLPPVAIALDNLPDNVPAFDGTVAAGCSFWQEATSRTFVTVAEDHALCSIGVHTHNFAGVPESQPAELQAAVQAMAGLGYVREEEVAAIPVIREKIDRVMYGPLSDFPVAPRLVLLFAHARQGLVLTEAVARVDAGAPPALGRPACAAIPQVLDQNRAAMSLGCCGARAYLDELSDDVALWALPGGKLDAYGEQIEILARANRTLTMFHERRREDVGAGSRPTVRESLSRLS